MTDHHRISALAVLITIFLLAGCLAPPIITTSPSPTPFEDLTYQAYLASFRPLFIVSEADIEAEFAKHGFAFESVADGGSQETRSSKNARMDMYITMPGYAPNSEPSSMEIGFLRSDNQSTLSDAQLGDLRTFLKFAVREDDRSYLETKITEAFNLEPDQTVDLYGDWWTGTIKFDPVTSFLIVSIEEHYPE